MTDAPPSDVPIAECIALVEEVYESCIGDDTDAERAWGSVLAHLRRLASAPPDAEDTYAAVVSTLDRVGPLTALVLSQHLEALGFCKSNIQRAIQRGLDDKIYLGKSLMLQTAPPEAVWIAVPREYAADFREMFDEAANGEQSQADTSREIAGHARFDDMSANLLAAAGGHERLAAALREAARQLEEAGGE
jgi:hypothetical protein